jgi:predicted metal-dependent enzyme (double-stranded beta helix superfamily)
MLAAAARVSVDPDRHVPYGRYLLHADPRGRYNIQLDVFSRGYVGGIHAHLTWGMLFVLRGGFVLEDWQDVNGEVRHCRTAWMPPGAGQCFGPPTADWHRVRTDPTGPQPISIHIYGPGFDMDTGVAIGHDGKPRTYTRGAWGNPADLEGLFEVR